MSFGEGYFRLPAWLRYVAGAVVGLMFSGYRTQLIVSLLSGIAIGATLMWFFHRSLPRARACPTCTPQRGNRPKPRKVPAPPPYGTGRTRPTSATPSAGRRRRGRFAWALDWRRARFTVPSPRGRHAQDLTSQRRRL